MATKGYQSYRGRMPGWKKLLIVVLVLILLAAGAFLLLQPKFVVDSTGGHWQGWLDRSEPTSSDEADPGADDPEDDFILDIQEPEVQEVYGRLLSVQADLSTLAEGERAVLAVKETNGTVVYGTVQDAAALALKERVAGRDAVAKISCFADTRAADRKNSMAVMSVSGKAWRDPNGNAWLDPYDDAVAEYLIGIVKDCVALGFTEILLEDVQFPTYGIVNRVTYGSQTDTAATRAEAINAFLRKVKEAAGEDVKVSILLPSALCESGTNETAGWVLSSVAQIVDRIYMACDDQAQADQLRAAVSALRTDVDAKAFFVARVSQAIEGGSYLIG